LCIGTDTFFDEFSVASKWKKGADMIQSEEDKETHDFQINRRKLQMLK